MTEQEFQIQDTIHKMKQVLGDHENILISISGGSDSDCLIELFQNHPDVRPDHKLHYVFFDTGLEYNATKRHLKFLEEKYLISIERERERLCRFRLPSKNMERLCYPSKVTSFYRDCKDTTLILKMTGIKVSKNYEGNTPKAKVHYNGDVKKMAQ